MVEKVDQGNGDLGESVDVVGKFCFSVFLVLRDFSRFLTDFTTLYLLHRAFPPLKDQAMMCCVLPEYLLNAVRSLNPHAKQVLMQKNDDNISFTDAVHALAVRS